MAEDLRQFKCGRPTCTGQISFNIKEVNKDSRTKVISCPVCSKKWNVSVDSTSCCSIYLRFTSIEVNAQKAIIKIRSYSKNKR